MPRNSGIIKITVLLLAVILAGCSGSASPGIETPPPASTPTPVPPTPTLAPPPMLLEYLDGVVVTGVDRFDSAAGWDLFAGSIADGSLEIIGNDWNGLVKKGAFAEGEGIVVDFKYQPDSVFEVFFDNGEFDTDPYRRLGIYLSDAYIKTNHWLGKEGFGFKDLEGNFKTEPGAWYSLLMALDKQGEFLVVVWDPGDASRLISYHQGALENWASLPWTFRIGANAGVIEFDDFMEITFVAIK